MKVTSHTFKMVETSLPVVTPPPKGKKKSKLVSWLAIRLR